MLPRSMGVIWVVVGMFCASLAIAWMVLEDRLLSALPAGLTPILGMFAAMVSLPALTPPPYGSQVTLLVGVFLITLGVRLITGMAGTRIVAAFIHVVAGLCLCALAFLLFIAPIPWPLPSIRYAACAAIVVLAFGLFGSAAVLYQRLDDPAAHSWKPFEQCPKCGRKLSAPRQCPIHDIKIRYPRLVDQARRKVYPIPLASRPVLVGRDLEAGVWFDETVADEYRRISRNHAKIVYNHDRQAFYITALPESSGVLVAEQPAPPEKPTLLPPDAIVKLGGVPFLFEVKEWYQAEVDRSTEDVRYALD